MRKFLCLFMLFVAAVTFGIGHVPCTARAEANLFEPIEFQDPLFEKKVRSYLGKLDVPITVKEASDVGELDLTNHGESIPDREKLTDISDIVLFPNLFTFSAGNNAISDLSPLKKMAGLKYLNFDGNPLSSLKSLASVSQLEGLSIRFCGIRDLKSLKGLSNLRHLDASDNAISDVDSLKGLSSLNYLNLSYNKIQNVIPLVELSNLKTLQLAGNPVSDWSVLSAIYPSLTDSDFTPDQLSVSFVIPFDDTTLEKKVRAAIGKKKGKITYGDVVAVTELNIGFDEVNTEDVKIKSIESLKYFTNLFKLDAWNNEIVDLTPLTELKNLMILNVDANPAEDLKPLSGLINLKLLYLPHAMDLTPLKDMIGLEGLTGRGLQISDISALASLQNLHELDLSYNTISDLSPLSQLVGLRSLKLAGNPVTDFEPIRGILPNLTDKDFQPLFADGVPDEPIEIAQPAFEAALRRALNIENKPITQRDAFIVRSLALYNEKTEESIFSDISPLKWFVNLEELEFNANPITDLAPLSGLSMLRKLNISFSQVSDLTPLIGLTQLENLALRSCPVQDISPLKSLTNLRFLDLGDVPVQDLSPLDGILKNLELIR